MRPNDLGKFMATFRSKPFGDESDPRGFWQLLLQHLEHLQVRNYSADTIRTRALYVFLEGTSWRIPSRKAAAKRRERARPRTVADKSGREFKTTPPTPQDQRPIAQSDAKGR